MYGIYNSYVLPSDETHLLGNSKTGASKVNRHVAIVTVVQPTLAVTSSAKWYQMSGHPLSKTVVVCDDGRQLYTGNTDVLKA